MKLVFPRCYEQFKCIADSCKKNCCCDGWDIEADSETVELFEKNDNKKGLMASLKTSGEDYYFKKAGGRCVWLAKDGLCRLYSEFGPEFQADICRQFPRFSEYFGNKKEIGIGLGCEEAARIIFTSDDPFYLEAAEIDEVPYADKEYDEEIAGLIFKLRAVLMGIAGDNEIPFENRAARIVRISDEFQDSVNDIESAITPQERTEAVNVARDTLVKLQEYDFSDNNKDSKEDHEEIFEKLEHITEYFEDLPDMRPGLEKELVSIRAGLRKAQKRMKEKGTDMFGQVEHWVVSSRRGSDYGKFMQYFLFRYFAKAVYDRDVALKGKMAAVFIIFIKLMDIAYFVKGKSRLSLTERINMAELFSREVEYSQDNMEQLYEAFLFDEIFTTDSLCVLLAAIRGSVL